MPSRQGWPSEMAVHKEMANHLRHLNKGKMDEMAGLDSNGYKNGLDFIITLVVVNFNSSSLTQIDTSYSILLIELIVTLFIKTWITSLHYESPENNRTAYSVTRLALVRTETWQV